MSIMTMSTTSDLRNGERTWFLGKVGVGGQRGEGGEGRTAGGRGGGIQGVETRGQYSVIK